MGRPRGAKDNKPRLRPNERTRCHLCPPDHPGWLRTEIKSKDRIPYCAEHLPDRKAEPASPECPDCGAEFELLRWNGSVEAATAHCPTDSCGFVGCAQDYYDDIDIKVIASPIESSPTIESVEVAISE